MRFGDAVVSVMKERAREVWICAAMNSRTERCQVCRGSKLGRQGHSSLSSLFHSRTANSNHDLRGSGENRGRSTSDGRMSPHDARLASFHYAPYTRMEWSTFS